MSSPKNPDVHKIHRVYKGFMSTLEILQGFDKTLGLHRVSQTLGVS